MDLQTIKAAIIKRSRAMTNLVGGQVLIFRDATILQSDNQSQIIRSMMITSYLNSKLVLKKPYRLFTVSFIIPVLLYQSGFLLIRKVNFVFGLYDGKDMREDIENGLKQIRVYRYQVMGASIAIATFGGFISAFGGVFLFVAIGIIAWFVMVTIVALLVPVGDLQAEMEELIDLDRHTWDAPPLMGKKTVVHDDSTASTQYKIELEAEDTKPRSAEELFK